MLAWQGNPRQDLLGGVDRRRLLIVDIDHDRVPRDDRNGDFHGAPFLFGGIWEFGGRTTLGANVDNITERLQRLGSSNRNMVGTAVFTEGMDTNPFAFDLFTEMAWRREPVDAVSMDGGLCAAPLWRRRFARAGGVEDAAGHCLRHPHRRREVQQRTRRGAGILFDAQPEPDV